MKKKSLLILAVISIMALITACNLSSEQDASTEVQEADVPDLEAIFALDEYPSCDGAALTLPMSEALCQALTGAERSEVTSKIVHNGDEIAWQNLNSGNAEIIFVQGSEDGLKEKAVQLGMDVEVFPVAYEYTCFYSEGELSAENSEKYISGADSDSDSAKTDGEENDGALSIEKAVAAQILDGTLDIGIKYANGYFISGYTPENIVKYAVDGVTTSAETVKSGEYPYVFNYCAVIRADSPQDSAARKVVDAILSDSGQKLLKEAGYVEL